MRAISGATLLEVLIVVGILTGLALPLFELFSVQRGQVTTAGREVVLNSYALQRLAEEESRLTVIRYDTEGGTTARRVQPPGSSLSVGETLSVTRVVDCTGLWSLTIRIDWRDPTGVAADRRLTLSRLVVDRGLSSHLPIGTREPKASGPREPDPR